MRIQSSTRKAILSGLQVDLVDLKNSVITTELVMLTNLRVLKEGIASL